MPLPTFEPYAPTTLTRRWPAAAAQVFFDVEPPPGFAAGHTRPGQFCRIRIAEDEGIFAMFNAPGGPGPRFLVRVDNPEGGEAANRLAEAPPGTPLEMTPPAGDGFALERARGCDLYCIATGTGIAPVRAALETVLRERDRYGVVSLDHGLRSEGHLALSAEDVARWTEAGVELHLSYSAPGQDGAIVGPTVQEALEARSPPLRHAAILAVGQGAMLRALKAHFLAHGGSEERFLTNY